METGQASSINHLKPTILGDSPQEDALDWLNQFEQIAHINKWHRISNWTLFLYTSNIQLALGILR